MMKIGEQILLRDKTYIIITSIIKNVITNFFKVKMYTSETVLNQLESRRLGAKTHISIS